MNKAPLILFAISALLPLQAGEIQWTEDPRLGKIFADHGLKGTFVVFDVGANTFTGTDQSRADTRFIPASTFKIPNSLIGLETRAVSSVDDPIPYTGPADPFIPAWAADMGLREAIKLSNVPIYKELARRIGPEKMAAGLKSIDYGNQEIGESVDTFWLRGPLKISAIEQAQFLAQLAQKSLPMSISSQEAVHDITLHESGPGWSIHAKTGWQNAPDEGTGWWVGWVNKEGQIYAFALNADLKGPSDGPKRIEMATEGLKILGILPATGD